MFKVEDIFSSGQYLVISNDSHIENTGYLSTIMFKVGYQHALGRINDRTDFCTPVLISMSDGYIQSGVVDKNGTTEVSKWEFKPWLTKQDLIDYLNNAEGLPYRLATQEEVIRVILHQTSRYK